MLGTRLGERLRICLVYDCLFPHTIGGVERWYRSLAERLVESGCSVTYLTLRQWDGSESPAIAGVTVVAVGPRMELYNAAGRRRIRPALAFGLGVARHLWRNGSDYDVVHTCAFPYFSVLAAAALRFRGRYGLVVDWFEVWSRRYWREYLGWLRGEIGWRIQRRCVSVSQRAFCFSSLAARRLVEEGLAGAPAIVSCADVSSRPHADTHEHLVVCAGRQIPEKRVPAVVAAVAEARKTIPDLRARILGDGPELEAVRESIRRLNLDGAVDTPGRVPTDDVQDSIRRAMCVVSASTREGFGLIVVEAAACGTPTVVVASPDNAATELIEPGMNGVVASSAAPEVLGAAIAAVCQAGSAMQSSTAAWFERESERLSASSAVTEIISTYRHLRGEAPPTPRARTR
jgi:glycosyltransferase involved in cell wall biosynthesis